MPIVIETPNPVPTPASPFPSLMSYRYMLADAAGFNVRTQTTSASTSANQVIVTDFQSTELEDTFLGNTWEYQPIGPNAGQVRRVGYHGLDPASGSVTLERAHTSPTPMGVPVEFYGRVLDDPASGAAGRARPARVPHWCRVAVADGRGPDRRGALPQPEPAAERVRPVADQLALGARRRRPGHRDHAAHRRPVDPDRRGVRADVVVDQYRHGLRPGDRRGPAGGHRPGRAAHSRHGDHRRGVGLSGAQQVGLAGRPGRFPPAAGPGARGRQSVETPDARAPTAARAPLASGAHRALEGQLRLRLHRPDARLTWPTR